MASKIAVIYVPGLGDRGLKFQALIIAAWRLYGVKPSMYQIAWSEGDKIQPKIQILVDQIDQLVAAGYKVALVGASAGGSAVMHAYLDAPHKVDAVIGICGVLNGQMKVSQFHSRTNPAFVDSVNKLNLRQAEIASTGGHKVVSFIALTDRIVKHQYSLVNGCQVHRIPIVGHLLGIAFGITVWSYFIIRAAKRTIRQNA